ncbi:DUF1642 domain-containing protein [Listeria monocytogenes]|nr:DUF1642 domain-containing protein [Listeria monocytogenes]EJE1333979.1 DUF1642 domain-containing protein [Listeria monocytogenes]
MNFKVGDEVQFIANNELVVGTIKHMSTQDGWVDMQASDSRRYFRKSKDVVRFTKTELIVVPQCVADWYEQHRCDLEFSIWKYIRDWDKQDRASGFFDFMDYSSNNSIQVLVKMEDGYEVEKEAKCESENLFIIETDKGICDSAMWIRSFETVAKELQYTIAHSKEDALTGDKLSMTAFACFLATHNSRHTYTVVPMNEAAEDEPQ